MVTLNGTTEIISIAKGMLNIDRPNEEMTDYEIQQVLRIYGDNAPGTRWEDGKIVMGRIGFELMLFLAITEFPRWYERHELSQWN